MASYQPPRDQESPTLRYAEKRTNTGSGDMSPRKVDEYRGYDICEVVTPLSNHFLIIKSDGWDYEQIPFDSVEQAKQHIECLHNQRRREWNGPTVFTTNEEAEQAYDESPEIPISHIEMQRIVDMAIGRKK
jgi:hypothetical protein